jgi:hypothetical protein
MDVDTTFPYFFGAIFAAVAITFVTKVIRYGGFKALCSARRLTEQSEKSSLHVAQSRQLQ